MSRYSKAAVAFTAILSLALLVLVIPSGSAQSPEREVILETAAPVPLPVPETITTTTTTTTTPPTTVTTSTEVPATTRPPHVVPTTVHLAPTTEYRPPTTPPPSTVPVSSTGGPGGFLACVRQHESRGTYSAVNPSSGAAGAYQFMAGTARIVAGWMGRSDLAARSANTWPPADQDAAAVLLYQRSGPAPWAGSGC